MSKPYADIFGYNKKLPWSIELCIYKTTVPGSACLCPSSLPQRFVHHAARCPLRTTCPVFVSFEIPAFTIGRLVSDFRHWGGASGDAGCHLLMFFYTSRRRSEKEKVLIYHYASPSSSSVFHVFIAVRLFAVFVEWIFHCLWLWLTVHWQSFRYRTMFYSYLSLIPAFNYSLLIMWTYNLMRFLCSHLLTSLQGCSSYCYL